MEMWSWMTIIFSGFLLWELLIVNICYEPTKVKLKESVEAKQSIAYMKKNEF